mgnify:CR=1 FL=1
MPIISLIKKLFINMIEEIRRIFLLFIFIIQMIYLSFTENHFFKLNLYYNYDNKDKTLCVYKSNISDKNKKYIYFFSGGFSLKCSPDITKIINDLNESYCLKNYNVYIIEMLDHSSLTVYNELSDCIKQNLSKDVEEIIFFGLSGGGVVASHLMNRCKELSCKKKIICYDSTFDVVANVKNFSEFFVYRIDMLMYYIVKSTYLNNWNFTNIKDKLKNKYVFGNGVNEFVKIVKSVENYDDAKLHEQSSFNFDQENNTKIVNIYSNNDPIIFQEISKNYIYENIKKNINLKNILKDTIGHCSDMSFNKYYLKYIIHALEY